ncbi:MAG: hypothetical protein U0U70_16055 [Chitinophagaceae bacterium]
MKKNIPDSAFYITRNDSVQTETDNRKSFVMTLKVVWKSPCSYDLLYISRVPEYPEGATEERKALLDKIRRLTTHNSIIKTGPDYYIFRATKDDLPMEYVDTMWKMP